jgi:pimeloyl-ACP methyl ester carboxylesterase
MPLAARGATPSAFARRCIASADSGRPPSFAGHPRNRELRRDLAAALAKAGHALPAGRIATLGAKMDSRHGLLSHSIRAGVLALAAAAVPLTGASQQQPIVNPPSSAPSSSFTIFVRAVRVGSEQISLERNAQGWTISSSSQVGAPIEVVAKQVQVRYTADWKPIDLRIDATQRGQPLTARTQVAGETAHTTFTQAGQSGERTDKVGGDAVLLPSPFWGPFEALSQRLKSAEAGSSIPAFGLQTPFEIQVGESSEETIQTASQLIHARRTSIKMLMSGGPLDAVIWGNEAGRLLHVSIPAQNLEVVREDIASVAARRVTVSRPGDEQIKIPANGFSLAGTISKPSGDPRPSPAVILVAGSGPTDRDEVVNNIPIFGQLAGALADAGFLVLRYDKRGVGQSGGRPESAALTDYADDLNAVVKSLGQRKDFDRKHLAVLGHSEGGSVAMLAAAHENKITALVLVAAIGVTGAELNMTQVTHLLDRSKRPEAERQATLDLQRKVQDAVLTGKGWEDIPEPLRRRADTPWFHSFLSFDPAKLMADVKQPLLVVQGLLDTQVLPSNADRLETLARARKKGVPVEVVRVPGINHLLVPATTGEVDEYATLNDKHVSPMVANAVSLWLQKTFAAAR